MAVPQPDMGSSATRGYPLLQVWRERQIGREAERQIGRSPLPTQGAVQAGDMLLLENGFQFNRELQRSSMGTANPRIARDGRENARTRAATSPGEEDALHCNVVPRYANTTRYAMLTLVHVPHTERVKTNIAEGERQNKVTAALTAHKSTQVLLC